MDNNTVNGKKIGVPAGNDENIIITGLDVAEKKREIEKNSKKVFAELENDWDLKAKGKVNRSITKKLKNKEDYLVFKTKDHVVYVENGVVTKREATTKTVKKEGTEK